MFGSSCYCVKHKEDAACLNEETAMGVPAIELPSRHAEKKDRIEELDSSTTAAAPREGEVIGEKYRIESLVGCGGMGRVFAATHIELGQRVAIKVLHQASRRSGTRFLREAWICARLPTEHVARVFDVGRLAEGQPYIVMEYLSGQDLAHKNARGRIAIADAVSYVRQVCAGLAEAHAA